MTNLTNLRRDMLWAGDTSSLSNPTSAVFNGTQNVSTDNTAYTTHGQFFQQRTNHAGTASHYVGFGVFMSWDEAGATPFRFKGNTNQADTSWWYAFENVAATPAVAQAEGTLVGYGASVDEVICVREMSGWVAQGVLFYCLVPADGGQTAIFGSVQKMLGQPDQFSSKVF